jgi:hypothetical protein
MKLKITGQKLSKTTKHLVRDLSKWSSTPITPSISTQTEFEAELSESYDGMHPLAFLVTSLSNNLTLVSMVEVDGKNETMEVLGRAYHLMGVNQGKF